jgi:biotin-(acetyl-CoA carboxylase) ligase
MVGTRKVAGVLVESRRIACGLSHVVGIGVNLNQTSFPAPLHQSAVSARMLRGDRLPTPVFFGQLMAAIEALWREPATWVDQWLARTRMIGRRATLHDRLGERSVDVVGVSRAGALQVRGEDGEIEQIISRTGLDVRVHWLDAHPAQASSFSGAST